MMYYIILFQDVGNDIVNVLHIDDDYNECLLKFMKIYEPYVNDPSFIARTVTVRDTTTVVVFKRIYGMLWDSKKVIFKFNLIKFSAD